MYNLERQANCIKFVLSSSYTLGRYLPNQQLVRIIKLLAILLLNFDFIFFILK